MEGPRAWVIRVVLQNNVSRLPRRIGSLDQLRIAALRVLLVGDYAIPSSMTLGEHVEIVPVEMHGVGGYELVVDYDAHRRIGAEIVNSPFGRVGEIAGVGEGEDRVARWRLAFGINGRGASRVGYPHL